MDQESYEPDTGTIPLTICKTQPHFSAIFSLAFVSYGWLVLLLKAGVNLKCRVITDHNAYPLFYISRVLIPYRVDMQYHKIRSTLATARSHYLPFTKEMLHSSVIVLQAYSTVAKQRHFHLMNQLAAKNTLTHSGQWPHANSPITL